MNIKDDIKDKRSAELMNDLMITVEKITYGDV